MKRLAPVLLILSLLAWSPAQEDPVTFTFAHPGPIRTMDAPVTWFGSTHWPSGVRSGRSPLK